MAVAGINEKLLINSKKTARSCKTCHYNVKQISIAGVITQVACFCDLQKENFYMTLKNFIVLIRDRV